MRIAGKKGIQLVTVLCLTGGVLALVWWFWGTEDPMPESPVEVERSALELVDGRLYREGETEPFRGKLVSYYEDGSLKSRSSVRDGLLDGLSEGWYPDGTQEVREAFREGVSHGTRIRWHANGQMAARARIVEGLLQGLFERWHENGERHQEIEMEQGKAHGLSVAYYPSGYVQAVVEMEAGAVVKQEFFEDGERRSVKR